MIEQALRYQTQGDDWVKRVAIGGGLLLFSIFLIPVFTVYGYMLEVIRNSLRGETEFPPEWGDYDLVELTINGLKAFVILFAYGFVVGIVSWVPSTLLSVLGGILDIGLLTALGTLVWFVLYFGGSLAVAVVTPVALSNFVVEEDISAGFDIDVLRNVIPEMAMLRAVGMGIAIYIITAIVSSIISIGVITTLLVPFIFFAGFSGMALVWGQGFGDAYRAVYGDLPTIPDGPVDDTGPVGEASTSVGESASETTSTSAGEDVGESSTDTHAGEDSDETTDESSLPSDDGDEGSADDEERWEN